MFLSKVPEMADKIIDCKNCPHFWRKPIKSIKTKNVKKGRVVKNKKPKFDLNKMIDDNHYNFMFAQMGIDVFALRKLKKLSDSKSFEEVLENPKKSKLLAEMGLDVSSVRKLKKLTNQHEHLATN